MFRWISSILTMLIIYVPVVQAAALDLGKAVLVTPPNLSAPERKAVAMLVEEVEKRTQIRWPNTSSWPDEGVPVVVVGSTSTIARAAGRYQPDILKDRGPEGSEGYQIRILRGRVAPAVFVIGNDSRGVLFGAGRLLRELHLSEGKILLDEGFGVATSPKYPLRGHQMGYRPKTNSYDAWTVPMWEQYIRDLAIFGTNAVELIPPRSDDAAASPHFPLPPMQMMVEMSRLLDEYGLDVWIWYPAMDKDYSDPATVEFALHEWGDVFKKLPRIDAVFVPGGDPGHTQPKYLMALLERQTQVLHRYHPRAQMWVSPQSFNQEWLDEFLDLLRTQQPPWLSGVVFGPQVRVSLPALRDAVPRKYPIRHYPDITHSRQCQYPVPDWDLAFAITEGREGINPRPIGHARIFQLLQPYTLGFITYSEGCNDDVNKILWSALGWDPDAKVIDILRQYSRYFLGERYTDDWAQGLLALERNWQGPLLSNASVDSTLQQFRTMEKIASPKDRLNWRFQQGLYRAYYDAYTRRRLLHETELEGQAMDRLRVAQSTGTLVAMAQAEEVLNRSITDRAALDWRARIFELAEALFQSIRMQLSVERYKAIAVDRGANLDTIDVPLNDRAWLRRKFANLRGQPQESDRLKGIDEILNWTNPGPGGFYDDLGNLALQPHLVRGLGFESDPAFLESSLVGFEEWRYPDEGDDKAPAPLRLSWWNHAEALNDTPLKMRYTNLDPKAQYKVRVVYAGDSIRRKIRLVADRGIEIHPFLTKPFPVQPLEFDIPAEATRSGELDLSWYREPDLGGNGRGCQVSEVWLIKK